MKPEIARLPSQEAVGSPPPAAAAAVIAFLPLLLHHEREEVAMPGSGRMSTRRNRERRNSAVVGDRGNRACRGQGAVGLCLAGRRRREAGMRDEGSSLL